MKVEFLKRYLKNGVVQSVLVTPFKENGDVDFDAFRALVSYIRERVKGKPFVLTPGGTTGEGYALTDDEWKKITGITVEEAGSSLPVIPGIIEMGLKRALLKAKIAQELGASGVMVVLPSYVVPSERGLYSFYSELARSLEIGVVVYNNPDVSKIYMKPNLLRGLAERHENIVGVKENTPSVSTLYAQLRTSGDLLAIWQGRGEWWYSATFHLGVKGFASGLSNFAPQLVVELFEAGQRGDLERLDKIRRQLWEIEKFFSKMESKYGPSTTILPPPYASGYLSISAIKAAMNILGLPGGRVRLPLTDLAEEDLEELRKILSDTLPLTRV